MKQKLPVILPVFVLICTAGISVRAAVEADPASSRLDLSGQWQVRLDRANEGEKSGWAKKPLEQAQTLRLPGSLTSNGIGGEVGPDTPWMGTTGHGGFATAPRYAPYRQPGNFKIPFWLQPDKYFKGAAWYQRDIVIPESWDGKHIELNLERCHWKTTVYVDGTRIGSQNSLGTPHRYDLTAGLTPGKHLLTVCVDNNYQAPVGPNASSITDHTQTNWNGIVGDLVLTAADPVWLEDVQAYPDVGRRSVRVAAKWRNATGKPFEGILKLDTESFNSSVIHHPSPIEVKVSGDQAEGVAETVLPMGEGVQLWDEFHPTLYRLRATLSGSGFHSEKTISYGMREIRTDGRTLLVNGVPAFMRGTLDCASFPKTGYPSTDVAEWRRIFKVCKAYGLNHVRYHSWCPPEAAFEAADLEGVYLQVECGVWSGAGDEPFLLAETPRIVRAYANHPSFAFLVHGNEPGNHAWLRDVWVPMAKKLDARYLVSAGSHHPLTANSDFLVPGCVEGFHYRYEGAFGTPPSTTRNYEDQIARRPVPCIAHETGQWCVFPNLKEIPKYTGCLKARNFEIVRDFMEKNHLLERADDFLLASGKFQTLVYKEDNEAYLRTRGSGGYQMLGLNDFPGQGTALVGVVDVFWEDKGYVTPAEFRRFNGPVVPLAIMPKRVYTNDETFSAQVRIAQYSGAPIKNAKPVWEITDSEGKKLAGGELAAGDIPVGNRAELGMVSFPLNSAAKAAKFLLRVSLPGTEWQNEWSFWVYPKELPEKRGGVVVCNAKDEMLDQLAKGATVLMLPDLKTILGKTAGTFQPIFWNKPWFPGQREHTVGLLIQNRHPAFKDFPTDFHADWQWWDLMTHSKPMVLDDLPPALRPMVEPIDDWNTCRRLGTLLEAKVGKGRVLIAAMDLDSELAKRPVARQLRESLLAYANSPEFQPKVELTDAQVSSLFSGSKAGKGVAKIEAGTQNLAH